MGIDTTKYREWTPNEVVDWIVSLQPQKMKKYEKWLRSQCSKQGISGVALEYLDKATLLGLGVEDFMDRVYIERSIQQLIQQNERFEEVPGAPMPDNTQYM